MPDDEIHLDGLREVTFRIGEARFTLREASDLVAGRWRAAVLRAPDYNTDLAGFQCHMSDCEAQLVSWCLYDAEGKLVPLPAVRAMPNRHVQALYKKLRQMSQITLGVLKLPAEPAPAKPEGGDDHGS